MAGLFGLGGGGDQSQPQQGGGMLDNPLAKVAMAGVAAFAAKKIAGGNGGVRHTGSRRMHEGPQLTPRPFVVRRFRYSDSG